MQNTIYGPCSLFKRYELDIVLLKKTTLQNDIDKEDHVISEDFLFPGTICAVAASETSQIVSGSLELILKSKMHLSCLLMTMDTVFLVVKNMLQANT